MSTTSDALASPSAQPESAARGWLGSHGVWLLGAAVIAAAIFALNYRAVKKDVGPKPAIEVVAGAWAQYAGGRWRVVSVRRNKVGPGTPFDLRADSVVVGVTFELVADKGSVASDFSGCQSRMLASDGRYWEANPTEVMRYQADLPTSCGGGYGPDFKPIEPQPGKPYRFKLLYQIPRNQSLRDMRVDLMYALPRNSPRNTLLRLALPPETAPRPQPPA